MRIMVNWTGFLFQHFFLFHFYVSLSVCDSQFFVLVKDMKCILYGIVAQQPFYGTTIPMNCVHKIKISIILLYVCLYSLHTHQNFSDVINWRHELYIRWLHGYMTNGVAFLSFAFLFRFLNIFCGFIVIIIMINNKFAW